MLMEYAIVLSLGLIRKPENSSHSTSIAGYFKESKY